MTDAARNSIATRGDVARGRSGRDVHPPSASANLRQRAAAQAALATMRSHARTSSASFPSAFPRSMSSRSDRRECRHRRRELRCRDQIPYRPSPGFDPGPAIADASTLVPVRMPSYLDAKEPRRTPQDLRNHLAVHDAHGHRSRLAPSSFGRARRRSYRWRPGS